MDVHAAADYLGVSHWTVRDFAWRGELPEVRLGRRLLFDMRDLDALIERNKRREGQRDTDPQSGNGPLPRATAYRPDYGRER